MAVENVIRRKANRVPVPASQDYQAELTAPGFVRAIPFRYSGTMATSGVGTPVLDTTFNYAGDVTIQRAGDTLLKMKGVDLRHLTALFADYHQLEPNLNVLATAGLPGGLQMVLAAGILDFEAPWAGEQPLPVAIDGTDGKITWSGTSRGLAFLGSTVTSATVNLDVYADTVPSEAIKERGDHLEPRFVQSIEPLAIGNGLAHRVTFGGPRLITHVMFRQFDASLETTNANVARSDALVRRIRILHKQKNGEDKELLPWTYWQDLKSQGTTEQGLASLRSGIALHSFDDPRTRGFDALKYQDGDEIVVEYDTESAVDQQFLGNTSTDTPPDPVVAAGDKLYMTWLAYTPRLHPLRLQRAA